MRVVVRRLCSCLPPAANRHRAPEETQHHRARNRLGLERGRRCCIASRICSRGRPPGHYFILGIAKRASGDARFAIDLSRRIRSQGRAAIDICAPAEGCSRLVIAWAWRGPCWLRSVQAFSGAGSFDAREVHPTKGRPMSGEGVFEKWREDASHPRPRFEQTRMASPRQECLQWDTLIRPGVFRAGVRCKCPPWLPCFFSF